VTAVYVLLWLISSSAWADAVGKIQHYTDPKDYFVDNYICECKEENPCVDAACVIKDSGNYSTAIVSVVRKSYHLYLCLHIYDCTRFVSHKVQILQPVSFLTALGNAFVQYLLRTGFIHMRYKTRNYRKK
jgi:hypothetical protein